MFGATEGMFLGYMISPEGIKPCPRTIKEVQSLNGKLASLNRFLSKSAEKSLPLFKTLKKCIKKSDFHWTPKAEQAFKQLKNLVKLPTLVAPKPKEELIMYLSTSYRAISAVLMIEKDTVQTPVYFVSRALQAPELNYTPKEKLVLALVCAAERLHRYFQAHPITVITEPTHQGKVLLVPDALVLEAKLRCVRPLQADYVIREIHEGSCGMHVGPQFMVAKAMRFGYYWPTMHQDARDMICKCRGCQIHRPVPRHPQQPLTPITSPSPFYKWGIDIAGPFPEGSGKVKFLTVVMDFLINVDEDKASYLMYFGSWNGERVDWVLGLKAHRGEGIRNWWKNFPMSFGPSFDDKSSTTTLLFPTDYGRWRSSYLQNISIANIPPTRDGKGKLSESGKGPYEVRGCTGRWPIQARSTDGTGDGAKHPYNRLRTFIRKDNPIEACGKDLDLSSLVDASSSDILVCVAALEQDGKSLEEQRWFF
ncbi:reverse transcriptase domain-containing protein [Tanacetum coccineum]